MTWSPEQERALRTARFLLSQGHALEYIVGNPLIPDHLKDLVRSELEKDQNFTLTPVQALVARHGSPDWTAGLDRSDWYYWPTLRDHLTGDRGWTLSRLRALDDSSDRVLREIAAPTDSSFDVRGLVLGYVQSGKTANFSALIAKAADAGYRLVIVLSGIDNGLRRQTNVRLKRELVGYSDNRSGSVRLPPIGRQWHEFTHEELDGDFQPGFANHAALQGSQPVLLIVKKNGAVLRRLLHWIEGAPNAIRATIPMLLVDDEADQAGIDTRGAYQTEDDPPDPDIEPPSVINGLVREVLSMFDKKSYVAYTATPFANLLIPHDAVNPSLGNDLFPKDFIIELPKPAGYLGAEELFGRMDLGGMEIQAQLDVVDEVPLADIAMLEQGMLPDSLLHAIDAFVLAGAARSLRGDARSPATMLIHTSSRIAEQARLRQLVSAHYAELRDQWRYQRGHGIALRLQAAWENTFESFTRRFHPDRLASFGDLVPHIGPFLEAVQIREINSSTGDVLDYEREPALKAIALGGNRLSRGLTLEGLTVSYFVRKSPTYDTLMQMGRWFGFRPGYEDLTRIWMTSELAGWFTDLAFVEHRLRQDIDLYESLGLTPFQVGTRIWQHPTMQVTSRLKRRFATSNVISQSYALTLEQTFKFPLSRPADLAIQCEHNRVLVRQFVAGLGLPDPTLSDSKGPAWRDISGAAVTEFVRMFRVDEAASSISTSLICRYVERLMDVGELTRWTVAVRGRAERSDVLGDADWGIEGFEIHQASRSRLGNTDSLGVIVSPDDEGFGLTEDQRTQVEALLALAQRQGRTQGVGVASRSVRPPEEGLLLLYPISKYSGVGESDLSSRRPIFDDPDGPLAKHLVGLAISFPGSGQSQAVEAYLQGTAPWRPLE